MIVENGLFEKLTINS